MSHDLPIPPAHISAIGYTRIPNGLPLDVFDRAVPAPADDEVLVHVISSSVNALDYKLAALNFLGRTPPVALGFDVAGIVVGTGAAVTRYKAGDAVFGMVPSNRDGVWAEGGKGGYAVVPEYLLTPKPAGLGFVEAGTFGVCFLSAHLAFADDLKPGESVYIPGGGGGVGHLAIQTARAAGAGLIVSSGGNDQSRSLARTSGADLVFDYRKDDVASEIAALTEGRGIDVAFDATYNESSFVATARMVRPGGRWIVLGVGPGKTSRTTETESPVAGILAAKDSKLLSVNLLKYYTVPGTLDDLAKALLSRAMQAASAGAIRPHLGAIIPAELDAINPVLADMQAGRSAVGKIAVIVDQARAR